MWKDSETNIDYLNIGHIVNMLNNLILDDNLTPATIGVYGAWGSGKSSVLKMSEELLTKDEDILCVKFNSWMFEDYFDIRAALITSIIQDMSSKLKNIEKFKDKVANLIKSINILGLIKKGVGYTLDFLLNKGERIIEGLCNNDIKTEENSISEQSLRENIRDFSKMFREILSESKIKRVVVYIDELDRCTPEKIIDILESIRLFAFVPGISFVIGADERLIKYAVDCKYESLPGNDVSIGKEYLDKLIQYTIYIPILSIEEMYNYICLLYIENIKSGNKQDIITKVISSMKEDITYRFDATKISDGLGEEIKEYLTDVASKANMLSMIFDLGFQGNPRKCKRFLNNLSMRLSTADMRKLDLKETILCKQMMLEYYKPEIFKTLVEEQRDNKGIAKSLENPKGIDDLYLKYREDDWFNNWLKVEPMLQGVELGNYIYVSRTNYKLGISSIAMSLLAEEVYKLLSSSSTINKQKAEQKMDLLNEDEAIAIFDKLAIDYNVTSDGKIEIVKNMLVLTSKKIVLKSRMIDILNSVKEGFASLKFVVEDFKKQFGIEDELKPFDNKMENDNTFKAISKQIKKGGIN